MIKINLLKPEKKELRETPVIPVTEKKVKKTPSLSFLIFFLFIVAIVALFLFQRKALEKERELLRKAEQERNELQYVIVKLEELEKKKSLFSSKIDLINKLMIQQEIPVRIMDELSKNIPEWVWLTEATFKDQNLEIKGNALSNSLIADYIFNLENSPYFDNVNLISSTQRMIGNDQFLEFSLTARYIIPQSEPQPGVQTPGEKDKK